MKRLIAGAVITLLGIVYGTSSLLAQNTTWINSAGGDFSIAANWDLGVPSATDNAIFSLGSIYSVNLTADQSINTFRQSGGVITLSGGQALNIAADSFVGDGTLTLTGSASQIDVDARFFLGRSGGNGVLNVLDQATLRTNSSIIGWATQGGLSGTATVNGIGSQWINDSSFDVGFRTQGSLQIENGGVVNSASLIIGQGNSAANGSVVVTGAGSSLTTSGGLTVGAFGTGGLTVLAGANVSSGSSTIGVSGGTNGTVFVSGAGSTWSNSGLTIGQNGNGAMQIENGGSVSVTGNASINATSGLQLDNGSISLTGTLTNSGNILVAGDSSVFGNIINNTGGSIATVDTSIAKLHGSVFNNGTVSTELGSSTHFLGEVSGAGNYTGLGDVVFEDAFAPGNSPAWIDMAGNVDFTSTSNLLIELGGLNSGEFDRLNIAGDLALGGGDLSISLVNGFVLADGQEFLFGNVSGTVSGAFSGLSEGALVGSFGDSNLFITYAGGTGNDLGLYVSAVPEPGSLALIGLSSVGLLYRRRIGSSTRPECA